MTDLIRLKELNPLPNVAARYIPGLTKRGNKYWGLCPFHDDHRATNFNIYCGRDGEWRFRCFACQEHGDVFDFVAAYEGCTIADAIEMLKRESLPDVGTVTPKQLPPSESELWTPIIPVPDDAPVYDPKKTYNPNRGRMVNYGYCLDRLDPYFDADENLLCWVARMVYEDGQKICPTITYCKGPNGKKQWVAKRMDPPYPLQGLDALAQHPSKHVILVSGEKVKSAIDGFIPDKFVVVSWLGGDDAVKNVDFTPLQGRKVTYWEDADHSGRRAMNYAYKQIEKNGTG